jgi:hypothetical protein
MAKGFSYQPLRLPRVIAALLQAGLGPWWQIRFVPYSLQISAWRALLLLNGLHCDGGELNQLLGLRFQDWPEGFRRMYA